MTHFRDGPAAGRTLVLRRAPLYLRVVWSRWERDPAKAFDALDRLDDAPRSGETVYVYRRVGDANTVWLRPGGRCAVAEYEFLVPQPDQDLVRRTEDWRAWAAAQLEKDRADRPEAERAGGVAGPEPRDDRADGR